MILAIPIKEGAVYVDSSEIESVKLQRTTGVIEGKDLLRITISTRNNYYSVEVLINNDERVNAKMFVEKIFKLKYHREKFVQNILDLLNSCLFKERNVDVKTLLEKVIAA